ncbi:hypothetical protein A8135_04070 [Legionella jamestowniensis]|uniref:Uncharacterized protein n=1 Tax=Legionella jamestowniensis TaxID=455 RepID=A0ABX2XV63_9GAMM|nr:hypothetical protein [Legionella jamestowniensis]OCH96826.1 hypothetical protein A8135_04070 [Legionella jamestowniensis]
MQEKREPDFSEQTFDNKYIFVRSDNIYKIKSKQHSAYQVSPAHHMNLSRDAAELYKDSGYLSVFPLTDGFGLQQALNLHSEYIHFICIDKRVCEHHFLTGGTRGLTKDRQETIVERAEGTCWKKPVFNHLIPQVFFTTNMDIELGLTGVRVLSEILLGGNWQDFVEVYSLSRKEASEMMKTHLNDKALYAALKSKTLPYPVTRGVFSQVEAQERIEKGQALQQVFSWWNQLKNKTQLCFTYGMFYQGLPYEPHKISFREMLEMHRFSQDLEGLFGKNTIEGKFFEKYIEISIGLFAAGSLDKFYQQISAQFIDDLKIFLIFSKQTRELYAHYRLPLIPITQRKLTVEVCFWELYRTIESMQTSGVVNNILQTGREKIVQGWQNYTDAGLQKEIIQSLMIINRELQQFITEQNFNSHLKLQSSFGSPNPTIGEWFKAFATKWAREYPADNSTLSFIPPSLNELFKLIAKFNQISNDYSKRNGDNKAYKEVQEKLNSILTKATHYQDISLQRTNKFMKESLKELVFCLATLSTRQVKTMLFINLTKKLDDIEARYLTNESVYASPTSCKPVS